MASVTLVFLVAAVSVVLVVGATGAYLPQATVTQTSHTQTIENSGQAGSKEGLVLGARLNASVVSPGQAVSLQVWEMNVVSGWINVSAARNWQYTGLSLGPCGLNYPFGLKVLAGYYTNASAGVNSSAGIQLYAPGPYMCPAEFSVGWYRFDPMSTDASLGGFCTPEPCGVKFPMNTTVMISGDYMGRSANPVPLAPGVYTVVVGDEWGASLFLYFTVASTGQQSSVILQAGTNITVSSSFDCVAGNFHLQFTSPGSSVLRGGFAARAPGVTLYVATSQQATNLDYGHPSQWAYTTGLQNSTTFSVSLSGGNYVIWIEGADLNCGNQLSIPLEMLTQVNVTQSFVLSTG